MAHNVRAKGNSVISGMVFLTFIVLFAIFVTTTITMKRNNLNILLAVSLILLAAVCRIFNAQLHVANFVPIAAISLFSGAIIKDKRSLAFLVPLMGQFLGDVYFQLFTHTPGFYDLPGQLFNYGALIAATALTCLALLPFSSWFPISVTSWVAGTAIASPDLQRPM